MGREYFEQAVPVVSKKVYHDEETISNAVEGLVDRVGGVIRLIAVYQFIMLVVGCR